MTDHGFTPLMPSCFRFRGTFCQLIPDRNASISRRDPRDRYSLSNRRTSWVRTSQILSSG